MCKLYPHLYLREQQVKIIFQRIFAERKQLEDNTKIAEERISNLLVKVLSVRIKCVVS